MQETNHQEKKTPGKPHPDSDPLAHIAWCKSQHVLIKTGGTWAVPRSGLLFKRTREGFELSDRMPFTNDMGMASAMGKDVPSTPQELITYQQEDFQCIQRHFKAADLEITDPKELLK